MLLTTIYLEIIVMRKCEYVWNSVSAVFVLVVERMLIACREKGL